MLGLAVAVRTDVGVDSGVAVLVGDGWTEIAVGLGTLTASGVGVQIGVGDGTTLGVAVGNVVPAAGKSGVSGDKVAVASGNQKFGTLFVVMLLVGVLL